MTYVYPDVQLEQWNLTDYKDSLGESLQSAKKVKLTTIKTSDLTVPLPALLLLRLVSHQKKQYPFKLTALLCFHPMWVFVSRVVKDYATLCVEEIRCQDFRSTMDTGGAGVELRFGTTSRVAPLQWDRPKLSSTRQNCYQLRQAAQYLRSLRMSVRPSVRNICESSFVNFQDTLLWYTLRIHFQGTLLGFTFRVHFQGTLLGYTFKVHF